MLGNRFEVNRVKLSDHIPMDTPFSVTMVPSSICNFACTFCPARIMKTGSVMSYFMAEEILDNARFPRKVKMLSLYNVGEPLINKDLSDIIRHANNIDFSERISLVTNASLLSKWLSIELIASGIDRIIISLYGLNDDDYLTTTNKHISFDTIYENIKYLNSIKGKCQIFIKVINRVVFTPERKQEFINKFQDHCDFYSIEPILPIWPNFRPEGDDPDLKNVGLYAGVPAVDRLTCHYPFYSMVVNARGFVNPCLADWNESVTLGNAKTDSLCDIWNSKEYNEFRLMQLQGKRRDHLLCSTCGTLRSATCTEDDIDGDRLRLLDKMFPGEGK